MTARYLLDASAIQRLTHRPAAEQFLPLATDGLIATCTLVNLRLTAAISDPATLRTVLAMLADAFTQVDTVNADLLRAQQLHVDLSEHGLTAAWQELAVAATAQRTGLVLLHYDPTFDTIAKITHQRTEWLP